nr:flagellar brake protein [Desulfobaculum xiamenense]
MLVEPAGMGDRFKTDFVGMVRGQYLIVRVPRIPGLNDYLYVEKVVTVRYLHEGQVFGFGSEVLWNLTAPFRLLFLRYPKTIETLNLRKAQRVDCFLPVQVGSGEGEGQYVQSGGMMLNLSAGGCQLVLDSAEDAEMPSFAVDSRLDVSFTMVGSDRSIKLTGKVKNVSLHRSRMYLGVMFHELDDEHRMAINTYVESVNDYLLD